MVNLNFDKDYGHQICTVQGSNDKGKNNLTKASDARFHL